MNIRCTRNTGFYGMGSPIEIKKNNQKWFSINHNQTKSVEIDEKQCVVQANFFLLKSQPLSLVDEGRTIELEVTMNPILLSNYVILFIGMILVPILRLNIIGIIFLLVIYFIFLFSMLNKAYIIKEIQ
ncbi:hypothetical protein [Enterococcus termitis]|jgi:hypothetical protein|uniref:Uncharacterized protein n=1 Tax=Enterococcus termitis TaxID=332950 RepID=A0A1E5G6V5_9ENTE|nr:hypothetical protein [Enterococcus termitis]OEG08417.1 hypothetical protein BCR25_13470 [Enterococcus termitis]OJG98039.1 hypothetical protein RV18_GL003735 [Enterococcus termitis]